MYATRGNTFPQRTAFTGAQTLTPSAMAALAIDVTKALNTKTVAAATVFTFTGTPRAGERFSLALKNSSGSPVTITLPMCFSVNAQALVNQFTLAANGRELLSFQYDADDAYFWLFGEPAGAVSWPVLLSASVNAAGTQLTANFSEAVSIGAGGNGGFALTPSGGAAALTYVSGSGSTALVYSISRTIQQGETLSLAYTQPGNGVEDGDGNDVANFTGAAVTNNSTQVADVTPPALTSAVVNAAGTQLTANFSEAVSIGAGGNGGFALTPSGGAATLTYVSGSGSTALVYSISRTILQSETLSLDYVQPGDGVEDAAGNDLANFSSAAVTNNSTQSGGETLIASDNFDSYADGADLNGSGNWANVGANQFKVYKPAADGVAYCGTGGGNRLIRNTAAVAANHSSRITLEIVGAFDGIGPAVRCASGDNSGYWLLYSADATLYLYKTIAGVETSLASPVSKNYATGNKLRLDVTGTGAATRLTAYEDTGSGWVAIAGMTNVDPGATYLDSGFAGMTGTGIGAGDHRCDDWEAYDV